MGGESIRARARKNETPGSRASRGIVGAGELRADHGAVGGHPATRATGRVLLDVDALRGAARVAGAVGGGQAQRVGGIAVDAAGAGGAGVAAPCADDSAVPGPLVGEGRRATGDGGGPGGA